jgi:hypothetical protein
LEQSELALRLGIFPVLANRGPQLSVHQFNLFNLRMARFVVRRPRPHGAEKSQKTSYGPQIICTAGIEAHSGILRSKNTARAFSKTPAEA